MKKLSVFFIAACLVFGLTGASFAQSHTVNVSLLAINVITVTGGDVDLQISTATPNQDPEAATDNSTCDVLWATNVSSRSIYVQSDADPVDFVVTVEAQGIVASSGVPASVGVIDVQNTGGASEFISGVGKTYGKADLAYSASCDIDVDPTAAESFVVTYTIAP